MAAEEYDLIVIGAGSGNSLLGDEMADWRVAIVEQDRFGGTCLNRGCIPSKMFVHAADVAATVRDAGRFGVQAQFGGADWPAIRDRVFGRIDPLHQQAVDYRCGQGTDVLLGAARFVGAHEVEVDGKRLTAPRIVIAAGSRPRVPEIEGLGPVDGVDFHTSDTIMRLDALPPRMLIVGGGFIAAEMGHVFGSLGTEITIVNRGTTLLANEDHDVQRLFTRLYEQRYDVRQNSHVRSVRREARGLLVEVETAGARSVVEVDVLLLAAGRVPNTDRLGMAEAGIALDAHGHALVDDSYLTNVPGVWALGDAANHFQLKHMANAESRIIRHNLLHVDQPLPIRFPLVPSAVFADPQVASVGAKEHELRAAGIPYLVSTREYSNTAYGWALEDTTSFVKLLAAPGSRLLLGAHIIGPEASIMIQPLIQAMALGSTVDQLAHDVIYIHPALTEVVEQALLDL